MWTSGLKLRRVIDSRTGDLHGGHDVGPHSGHGVELHPLPLALDLTPLVVVPTLKAAGAEPSGVNCKVNLYFLERQCRQLLQGYGATTESFRENADSEEQC